MNTSNRKFTTIDEYIAIYPQEVQLLLQQLRKTIHEAAPEATEAIRYGIPTFQLHGNLVHFGAYEHHIGFYPAPAGIEQFKKDLAPYLAGKGTIQFPLDQPLPLERIKKIVEFRIQDNLKRKK